MEKRMLTPEVRAALLSKIPFSVNATTEYTPKPYMTKIKDSEGKDTDEYSIPEEFRPVFTVRSFTKQESYDVKKVCTKGEEKGIQEWTRKVVIGWKNMFDAGTLEEIEYIQRHGSPAFSPEERAYLIEEGTDIGAYLREEQ